MPRLNPISSSTAPKALYIKEPEQLDELASKTNQVIDRFRQLGLYAKYCGPFTVINFLHLNGYPLDVDSVVGQFDIDQINRVGCSARKLQQMISDFSDDEPIRSKYLSSNDVDYILSREKPIAALLSGHPENHWLTLVGADDEYFYGLDFNQIRPFEKESFLNDCLMFVYSPVQNYYDFRNGRRGGRCSSGPISSRPTTHYLRSSG